jgi:GNAT superfamily N-acetyltransferase
VHARYVIVRARPRDVAALPAIERAAATLLVGHMPQSIVDEITDEDEFVEAQAQGRLWVALDDDRPVGFALVDGLDDGTLHLEEIDVDPRHGRRGVGATLVRAVCQWAAEAGHATVTLTTARDLPWNMPFYARLGFRILPRAELTPDLAAIVRDETARGLDPDARVVMQWRASTRT